MKFFLLFIFYNVFHSEMQPIRIIVETSCLEKQNIIPTTLEIVKSSLTKAKTTLENLIKIEKLPKMIETSEFTNKNNRTQYIYNSFNSCISDSNRKFINDRFDADLVIYIKKIDGTDDFDNLKPGNEYVFQNFIARPEILHSINGRPVLGSLVYNDFINLPSDVEQKKEALSYIFLHEFTHILGFTKSILRQNNIIKIKEERNRMDDTKANKTVAFSTKILNISELYFNCSIEGLQMNDQINIGDYEDLHWEPRLLLGDYMTTDIYYPDQVISEFTLALLDSLDFYEINYYTGGLMNFGKNKGCQFLYGDCIEIKSETEVLSKFNNEFCSSYEKSFSFGSCSTGRQSMGYCFNSVSSASTNSDVNKRSEETYIGLGPSFIEYCPISYDINKIVDGGKINEYYNGNCKLGKGRYGSDLTDFNIYEDYSSIFEEQYGNNSFCALSSILKKDQSSQSLKGKIHPACYAMFCSKKSLTIQINKEYIVCPRSGGLVKIEDNDSVYEGMLFCPDYNLICSGTEICNNMFDCVDKKSSIKETAYDFSDYSNINITIGLSSNKEEKINEKEIEGFEESNEGGKCPLNCRQCNLLSQCIKCRKNYIHYVGNKENDTNKISCYNSHPGDGYYIANQDNPSKIYYFTCIENCKQCNNNKDLCDICFPTHFVDVDSTCKERIPGCKDYDNSTSSQFYDNVGHLAYKYCSNCDNNKGFYCVDGNKTTCVNLTDYDNETYYNMESKEYPCVQKCDIKFKNCSKCTSQTCIKCKYDNQFINDNHNCVENITHCSIQNRTNDNKECLKCDREAGYYCIGNDTINCERIDDIKFYYSYKTERNIECIERCNNTFENCMICTKDNCEGCREGYYINNNHHCLEKIENCKEHNLKVESRECLTCEDNYYCIKGNTASCEQIDNIKYYYFYNHTENNIQCIERCNNTFNHCAECTKNGCTACENGYFVYKGRCEKNITGCIDHSYDGTKKECNECNNKESYYCLNNTRTECYLVDIRNYTPYYYLSTENNFPCYITCDHILSNCLTCDNSQCIECTSHYIINDAHTLCLDRPFDIPENDNCTLKIIETSKTIFEIDPNDLIDNYWYNIPYISTVDHYVGNNFTITVFVNSECTEDLFDKGYYKIESLELQNTMIKESHTEGMKILFSVYINYNHKSHLRYYNISSTYLDPYKLCSSCFNVDYSITNKFYDTLNDTFGKAILSLVYSENLDILDKESGIFNDICENVTLYGIDIPLKKRLYYLYLHKYREPMLCNSENCTVEKYYYENSTIICKCRMGNKYEDVIYSEKFEYQPYDDKEDELKQSNEFVESLSTIKCSVNGFKLKNFKPNIGLFICIGFIAIQIGLFVFYCVHSKPVVNVNKSINMSSPPKKTQLKIITDWDKSINNDKMGDEDEIFVQPRDDADDQLLEEERSYADNMIDLSGLSIETNFGGAIKNISTGNKLNEKADQKRVLILLSNRGKNKSKNLTEDMKSDSDIIPQIQDENNADNSKSYGKIYWHVLSLKQHIINFFSFIDCCKITESYIPLSIRLIRSLFMIILSLVLNIICLNQTYYDNKFDYFNKEYIIINSETDDINIPSGKRITYAIKNTFGKAVISFIILLAVQFIFGIVFFSVRKSIIKAKMNKNHKVIKEIIAKSKKKNIAFYIIVMVCMILFFFTISGFIGIYGGGVVDYLTAGIISLILLEIFPFIWSLIIALFIYLGMKNNNKCCYKFSGFFMF